MCIINDHTVSESLKTKFEALTDGGWFLRLGWCGVRQLVTRVLMRESFIIVKQYKRKALTDGWGFFGIVLKEIFSKEPVMQQTQHLKDFR